MSRSPLVSAIMIFLDGEKFIEEAIESVLAQTYENWELLLVDDGSTDRSTDIACRYAATIPDRVRYLEHEAHANRGMSASRNLGIRHARGEYVAFLDADDVWLPLKFERQVPILEAAPGVAMLYGPTEYWYSWSGLPGDAERDRVPSLGVALDTVFEPMALSTLVYPLGEAAAPCLCSLLVRLDAINAVGGFEDAFHGFYEDQAFLAKMYLRHPILVSGGCWDRYRIHADSCSAVTRDAGGYDLFRRSFLKWLREYLDMHDIDDSPIRHALADALSQHVDTAGTGEPGGKVLRLLRVADGNAARLVFPPDNIDMVRVDISNSTTNVSYDIQLSQPRYAVQRGHRCALSFLARADQPRSVGFGFARGRAPWTNLGMYDRIDLTPEWQSVEREFVTSDTEDNARVHFDVGDSSISVEVSSVILRSLTEGKAIKPGVAGGAGVQVGVNPTADREVPLGDVRFGSFRRVTPISQDFGYERGRPVDRYYIENFLESCAADVRGRVLEVGDRTYTRRFGGDRVVVSDMLHVVEGEPEATIIGDLASADHIPSDAFDCVILTQTLQLIYDFHAAIRTIHRILKPEGVLLATFPGISQTYDTEWGGHWCWAFTRVSATRMFGDVFGQPNTKVETFGNVLAAVCFLHGLSVEEMTTKELDYHEPGYAITVAVRAEKA